MRAFVSGRCQNLTLTRINENPDWNLEYGPLNVEMLQGRELSQGSDRDPGLRIATIAKIHCSFTRNP